MKLNFKLLKNKNNTEIDNSFQSFSKSKRTESLPNLNSEKYKENISYSNNYNTLNPKDIQEIHINFKNIPKGINNKKEIDNKIKNTNISERNSLSFRNKINNSFSQESINSENRNIFDSIPIFHNNTYTQPTSELYKIKLEKKKEDNNIYKKYRKKENKSFDITYYKPTLFINNYENNNNSFLKKYDLNEYYSQNNSFNIIRTNFDEDNKSNNTVNYNRENFIKHTNSLSTVNSIPKPKKFKKKIPPISIKRQNESNNNSLYFEDINNIYKNNNNNNSYNPNHRYYGIKTVNNADLYKNKRKIFMKKNINEYKNKLYINRTHSPRYLKNIEKFGIKLSFNNKKKNDSIDLISPKIFNDLKAYSYDKPKRQIFFSDLTNNKINKIIDIHKQKRNNERMENYNNMRKKYIKRLSSYLLKNKNNKSKKINTKRNGKYDIIDIKEKIKENKKKRTISNKNKFKKNDIIKDSPSATYIKKEDDKGGKIDFKLPTFNIWYKNNSHKVKNGINSKYNFKTKINTNNFRDGINTNKNNIHLYAAKLIQKWWRNILIRFFTELSITKIQSIFRGYLYRKKLKNNIYNEDEDKTNDKFKEKKNIKKIIFIQRKWREFFSSLKNKKNINNSSIIKEEEEKIYQKINKYQYDNNLYGNMSINNMLIQKNNNFGIVPDNIRNSCDDKNGKNYFNVLIKNNDKLQNNEFSSLIQYKNDSLYIRNKNDKNNYNDEFINNFSKSDYKNDKYNENKLFCPIFINEKKNLKICYYTKEYYKNIGNEKIIFIQKNYRNYLNNKNNNIEINVDKIKIKKKPTFFPCFINRIRLKKSNFIDYNKNNTRSFNNNIIKINSGSSTNPIIINYRNDIDFSIKNEKINEIKIIPCSNKCYISKNNIYLMKKKLSNIDLKENNRSNYNGDSFRKNNKADYQISNNINNYIKNSYSKEQLNYINSYNNKYLISYFSNEINGKPKKEPIYLISSINTNIISSNANNTNKRNILEIDNQNKDLNFIGTKLESIEKIPIKIRCYITKYYILKDNNQDSGINYKLKFKTLNGKIESKKDEIYKTPQIKNNCFISKINKKDNSKEIKNIQNFFKKKLNKNKNDFDKIYMRIIVSNNVIIKEYKDNRLDKNKIKLIQKIFRKFKDNKRLNEKKNLLEKYTNKALNNKVINSNNNNIQSRNNKYRKNSNSSISSQKNTQTYENTTTNYGTKDNIIKTRTSFQALEKKEKILNLKNIIDNKYENKDNLKNLFTNSDKDENYIENNENSEKADKNIEKDKFVLKNKNIIDTDENKGNSKNPDKKCEKDEKKNDKEINNEKYEEYQNINNIKRIRTAYQIKIYKRKKDEDNQLEYDDLIKMINQRIKKNINQFAFEKIKVNDNRKNNNPSNEYINNDYKNNNDDENISLSSNSEKEPIKVNFFFKTIKRHLQINKKDNNLEENNEINNLLKNNIPECFENYRKKNYISYINKEKEENLVNNQLYLFNDDKLADYIYKCYKIEKNNFTIPPYIIKNRLIKEPLKNQNLFTITRYMDNLYDDIITGNICQNCCCKNNELCLSGCKCHNNQNKNLIINDNIHSNITSNDKLINNTYDLNKYKNLINHSNNIKNKKNLKFEILKRFSESNEDAKSINSYNNLNNRNEAYSKIYKNNTTYNTNKKINDNEIYDRNSNHTEYIKKYPNKSNKLIKNFIERKYLRNSLASNKSSDKDELEIINYDYNYNNNLREKISEPYFDNDQCNIYDDDIKNSNDEEKGNKKINKSLSKKKMSPIIPFPNKTNNIIKKVKSFRYEREQNRKKNREIIKLRDTNYNYDNEIYENI